MDPRIKNRKLECESVLVLVFEKSNHRELFSSRTHHTGVELMLINSPPPLIPAPGLKGIGQDFDPWKLLGIHVDRMTGVRSYTARSKNTSSGKHDVLCVPLSSDENKSVIDFMAEIRDLPFNHWDSIFSRTASLIPMGAMEDITIDQCMRASRSVKCLHAAQLVVLAFRNCLDPKRTVCAKLWGFNSRLTTANEIFEELRMACISIDADALNKNSLQALYGGTSNVM